MKNLRLKSGALIGILLLALIACEQGPTITNIAPEEDNSAAKPGVIGRNGANDNKNEALHVVVVKEAMDASRYVYLKVSENGGEDYWIAAIKQDVTIGDTYFYKGGLLKTNFESKEHNKVFDKIYLVTNLVHDHGDGSGHEMTKALTETMSEANSGTSGLADETENIDVKGSIKIAEIVNNPTKYEGKTVQVSGKVVKINPNIMKRNWIHLQDGSKNDYDFVITLDSFIPEGSVVTLSAVVALKKDFGAGYYYDIILEDGKLIQ